MWNVLRVGKERERWGEIQGLESGFRVTAGKEKRLSPRPSLQRQGLGKPGYGLMGEVVLCSVLIIE